MSEARRHASEAKLKLLETQLEPHMLFNSLANLRVLIGTDSRRAQEMLDHMRTFSRRCRPEDARITCAMPGGLLWDASQGAKPKARLLPSGG